MPRYATAAVIAAIFVFPFFLSSCNDNNTQVVPSKEDSLKMQVDWGDYLVHSVVHCTWCHSQLDFTKFSLPVIPGTEGGGGIPLHEYDSSFPGKLWFPNITPFALKDWTDAEIAIAITKGIRKNGDTLTPVMPFHDFSKMCKEDVASVIAYIRTFKPIDTVYPKRDLIVPVSVFGPLPGNDYVTNVRPDTTDPIKYGEYLVSIAGCSGCHTPAEGRPMAGKLFAGGNENTLNEFTVRTANITPDTATGIGTWTEDMFVAKFRNNSSPENINRVAGKYNTLMPWTFFGAMKEGDLKAIYKYLRTVPAVHNTIVKWPE